MTRPSLTALLACVLCSGAASAQVTFELIDQPFLNWAGTDISADGTVIVGNQVGPYETFRWTAETGAVLLGRGTVEALGVGAGSPDVSADGTRISATIVSDDGTSAVAGIWENGAWTECAPMPLDMVTIDQSDASAWGLSGDGQTVVGLYWRLGGGTSGNAYPLSWSAASGGLRLGPGGVGINSGRANAANFDGSVVVGWRSNATGAWQPAVWENGVETIVEATLVGCPLSGVNAAGNIVLGQDYNPGYQRREACFWTKNGGVWTKTQIGVLPGTTTGQAYAVDCSADGSIIIGSNTATFSPGSLRQGWIWTPTGGMVEIGAFLANHGVTVDPYFYPSEMSAITPDGRVMLGLGRWSDTGDIQSFLITLAPPAGCAGDADANNVVNFDDITGILVNWGAVTLPWQSGDTNGDSAVNFDDITETLANWGATCAS